MWESISIVIPVYNSEDSLEELHHSLSIFLYKNCRKYEMILVDDGSHDNSYDKMQNLREKDKRVKVIQLEGNYGQQNALMCGFRFASGDYIITMDDDLQHKPEDINKLLERLSQGYDVVYGIPQKKQHSFYRRFGSKLTNILFNIITDKPAGIRVSSFRVFTREVLNKIIKDNRSFVYISSIILNHTINISNISVNHLDRKHGRSNYNFFKLLRLFIKLFIYYSNSPLMKIFQTKSPQYKIKDKKL